MAPADPSTLAAQVRRLYVEQLSRGIPGVVRTVIAGVRELAEKPTDYSTGQRRRDALLELQRGAAVWQQGLVGALHQALVYGQDGSRTGAKTVAGLALVDDDTIDREILGSRLALAVMDRASWEFTDLCARIAKLERREELDAGDVLRAHVLARLAVQSWCEARLTLAAWRELQPLIHDEFALLAQDAYHEVNHWLVERRVLPEIDLRPHIRRSHGAGSGGATGFTGGTTFGATQRGGAVAEETRMMTRAAGLAPRAGEHADVILERLNRLVGKQVPAFVETMRQDAARKPSRALDAAIGRAEQGLRQRYDVAEGQPAVAVTTPALLEDLNQRKQSLKQAAETPIERATIEIVALLFQSILTEERIPASVRVWFARLQMPVLRVAVGEPDFFATVDHPARKLIDRMGACVLGFDASTRRIGDALEREIKRVVQVVEAYPDTGRRVFQTVLTEFERFLENYFSKENEVTRKGVSLAQQIEQRETLAIQYTIELRKMLNEVPVQEGVRQFLFQVWADVLATTAVTHGTQSEPLRAMRKVAADLIWSASAKVSRDERAEVIRRLPPLLKSLRDGMAAAGLDPDKQDEHVRSLNTSLAAAFTAKAAAIPHERLEDLMERLETIEEMLPEASDVEIDGSMVLDLSGHTSEDLDVVAEGGSMPTPAMLAWARELQVGSWFMLDYRGRQEPVQLAWQGMRRQLSLFVATNGHCVLFQQQRLAAFLQAGLLLPAQDEALTVRATRTALAKLDVDPGRLLG